MLLTAYLEMVQYKETLNWCLPCIMLFLDFKTFIKSFYVVFQAIVLFVGAKSFKELLSQSFSSLCKDPVVCVRKSLSSGFHEVCAFFFLCVLQNALLEHSAILLICIKR